MAQIERSGAAYFRARPYTKTELEKFEVEGKEPPKRGNITFEEALTVLEEANFLAEKDEKLKAKWAAMFHKNFCMWF